jgi:neocarzinostatin family protein
MKRQGTVAALILGGAVSIALSVAALPAGASGISVKASPAKGLSNGQTIKLTGKGLPYTSRLGKNTFFVDECNAAVKGKLSTADTLHCDVALARAVKLAKNGTFTAKFKVVTGKVGDGMCGVPGSLTCVIGVGDTQGQGTVVKVTFK